MKRIGWLLFYLLFVGRMQGQSAEQHFDGRFRLYAEGGTEWERRCFWNHLKPYKAGTCILSHRDHGLIIEILDKKRICFHDVTDSCEERLKVFHYYRDGDTIIIPKARNRWFFGVPPFFFATHAEKLVLFINEDKDLVLRYKGAAWGMVFPIAAGDRKEGTELYKRKII